METFAFISEIFGLIHWILAMFHINVVGEFFFKCFDYCNKNQLIYLLFSIALFLALVVYYRKDCCELCSDTLKIIREQKKISEKLICFLIATLPAIVVFGTLAVLRHHNIFFNLFTSQSPHARIAPNFLIIIVAAIMFWCDRRAEKNSISTTEMSRKNAAIIGLTQLVSIFPGIIRLDISFAVMRYLGYSRADSFRYFVMISLPLQIGSCISQAFSLHKSILYWNDVDVLIPFISSIAIFLASLGLLYLINWFLKKFSLLPWALYRIFMNAMTIGYFYAYAYPGMIKLAQQ